MNPFRYRGYYFDSETGFYYLQSRYYDPYTCRFINADAAEFVGATGTPLSYNLFLYCENDPVNNYDPTGHVVFAITYSYGYAALFGFKFFVSLLFDLKGEIGIYYGTTLVLGFSTTPFTSFGIYWKNRTVRDYVNAVSFSWNVGIGLGFDFPDYSSKRRFTGIQFSLGASKNEISRETCAIDGGVYISLTKHLSLFFKSARSNVAKITKLMKKAKFKVRWR